LQTHGFTTVISEYQILKNGLRLAFVKPSASHKNARKACISVTINQGHFNASEYPNGFAHLYEHMLFNASTTYKKVDALDNHLFVHNGQVNGWTQDLSTNFQMNCDQAGFVEACNIFIDRLSSPLFLCEDIEKEIVAINAEFISKIDDPVRQLLSVQKASCNVAHPFHAFSTGNAATLSVLSSQETQSLLQKYHQQVMQGKHISICVGTLNSDQKIIDELYENISASFTMLDNKVSSTSSISESAISVYLPKHLNKFIQIATKNTQHQLITSYIIEREPREDKNEHRETLYIMLCHLLESKHEHGLFHLLKSHDLANNIHSYFKEIDKQNDELVISIQLTDEGAKQAQTIYAYVQAYIDYLHLTKIEPWRFREKANQYALSLNVNKGSSLLEDCIEVSQTLSKLVGETESLEIALENLKVKSESLQQDSECKQQSAEFLPWQHMPNLFLRLNKLGTRVYFISSLASTNKLSAHYMTPYSEQTLAVESKAPIRSFYFVKPRQNPYVAGEYPLISKQREAHELMHLQSIKASFKFYQDLRFNLPTGECYISITEPEMYGSISQIAAKRVGLSCLNEYLASRFFDVDLASIHFRVYAHHHGISLHTGGLSERQLLLCIELINSIRQFTASKTDIERHLKKTLTTMNNKPKQRPINQAFSILNEYYVEDSKKQSAILLALQGLNVEAICKLQDQYFRYNFIETLLIGNWRQASAKAFYNKLNGRFQALRGISKPKINSPDILSGQHIHKSNPSSKEAILVWHCIPLLTNLEKAHVTTSNTLKLTLSARALIMEKLLSHTIFDVLRQQHKMGYELGVGYKPIGRYPGLAIYTVSQTHSIEEIFSGMQEAIHKAKAMLIRKDVSIEEVVAELTKQVIPRETDISQTASRAWSHFEDENPVMAYTDLIDALMAISTEEILKGFDMLANTSMGQVVISVSNLDEKTLPNFVFPGEKSDNSNAVEATCRT
jgi:secreted Zn-dependent insulinase-like peptidase